MKLYLLLLSVFFVAVFASIYLVIYTNKGELPFLQNSETEIRNLLIDFQRKSEALTEINLRALYAKTGQLQIIYPIANLQKMLQTRASLCRSSDSERESVDLNPSVQSALKENLWKRFLYDKVELPENFLDMPPYLYKGGSSYAYLLLHSGDKHFDENVSWIKEHLSNFTIFEVKEILQNYQIKDQVFKILTEVSTSEFEDLIRGTRVVLSEKYVFIGNQILLGFSPLSYWVYDRASFDREVHHSKYQVTVFKDDVSCLFKEGNICWNYNQKQAINFLFRYSVGILIVLLVLFFVTLILYFKRLGEKTREQQLRRLSLQVLSHEFRTPLSTMLLQIDQLNHKSIAIDAEAQEMIGRISREVFRLQRIIEVSKVYLQAENKKIKFNFVVVHSMNQWVEDFVSEFDRSITFRKLKNDISVNVDQFWLKFIISNLVQNAFNHGSEPVSINLEIKKNDLEISVIDAGKCEFKTLHDMTESFAKSNRSKGMGLGLNIVQLIIKEWRGELRYSSHPTTFTLVLRGVCEKNSIG